MVQGLMTLKMFWLIIILRNQQKIKRIQLF